MRQQYDTDTVVVEITVRHTHSGGAVQHQHEVIRKVGSDGRPEWLNRHIVAAVAEAANSIQSDFGVNAEDIRLGMLGDFVSARRETA